jgi:predicted permease
MSLLRRLRFLSRRDRLDDELKAEIEFHIEQKTRSLMDEGLGETAARREALRRFGNPTRVREESRSAWSFTTIDIFLQDVRYAIRALARQPFLVLVAVVSLGSAMAGGAAVFSLADAVLFAKLPVPDPDRLVAVRWRTPAGDLYQSLNGWNRMDGNEQSSTAFSFEAYAAARAAARGRAEVFAFADLDRVSIAAGRDPEVATGQAVSGNYFSTLGLRPAAGRFIAEADDRVDAREPVAVISYAYWDRRFGGRADAVGTVVRVNGVPTTIVGVSPPGFNGSRQVGDTSDVSLPIALRDRYVREPDPEALKSRDPRFWWVVMMARLADGATSAEVRAAIEPAVRQVVAVAQPAVMKNPFRVEVTSAPRGQAEQRAELVEPVAIMSAIVGVVILIACANLANLLLARGAARDREIAVRLAIGATRGRLVRQLLVESAVLGVGAGAAGIVTGSWLAGGLLPALGFDPATTGISFTLNWRVVAFAAGASLACTTLFGVIPAFRGSSVPPIRSMKEGTGTFASRIPRLRVARVVLAAQVALSVLVLVAAALLVRSMRNLERVDPGFDPRGVLLFRVDPTLMGYDTDKIRGVLADALQRVRALPGVQAASLSQHGLMYGWSSRSTLGEIEGRTSQLPDVNRLIIEKDFFRTMRIPMLAGNGFTGSERAGDVVPVVISRAFAERGFGTLNAVGHTFKMSTRPGQPSYRVIGVAGDVHLVQLNQPAPPTVFLAYTTQVIFGATVAVRTAGDPQSLADAVRGLVATIDPDVPVQRVRTQEEEIRYSLREERLFATLAAALGGLALLLACIGVYGLMAYAVARRTPEIGVRMALGAERGTVLRMVVGDAARLTASGLVIGLALTAAGSRFLESRLFGLTPSDAASQAAAAGVLLAVAVLAAYVPARRAARVDPMLALKAE